MSPPRHPWPIAECDSEKDRRTIHPDLPIQLCRSKKDIEIIVFLKLLTSRHNFLFNLCLE